MRKPRRPRALSAGPPVKPQAATSHAGRGRVFNNRYGDAAGSAECGGVEGIERSIGELPAEEVQRLAVPVDGHGGLLQAVFGEGIRH